MYIGNFLLTNLKILLIWRCIVLEELSNKYLPILIHLFELMGIFILVIGVCTAFYHYILNRFKKKDVDIKYEFADVMVTTLDFKLEFTSAYTFIMMFFLKYYTSSFIIKCRGFTLKYF